MKGSRMETRRRVSLAGLLGLACLLALGQQAQSRSLLASLPGARLLEDLSRQVLSKFDELLDAGLAVAGPELEAVKQPVEQCLEGACSAAKDPDARRNVSEIIRSRGFEAQELEVTTGDGYILTIQRIVNPLVPKGHKLRRPVVLQHGLMSSSVDWVINSVNVYPVNPFAAASATSDEEGAANELGALGQDSQQHPNSLGFYLANRGYDVYLANSRGNIYGQKHVRMSSWQPKFWDFTFDQQIEFDLPAVIERVQKVSGSSKVAYVGHSQGTTMALGLLADKPQYADILEPVVLLAPVAYVNNCISPARYFAVYTPVAQHINMWFGSSNVAVRVLGPLVCGPEWMRKQVCANLVFLGTGFDEQEFDESRAGAYMAHMPSGTSVKNIAHWGQEVRSGRFAHFDHGLLANQAKYGRAEPPAYELANIRSKSIVLFTAENDWLASPKDVARLKAELKVAPMSAINVTESMAKWNHIDFVYGKDCGVLVNKPMVELLDKFD